MNPTDAIADLWRRLGRRLGVQPLADSTRFSVMDSDIGDAERQRTDMHRAFYRADGPQVTKWTHYLSVYDRHLSRFRNADRPVRLLEIGVYKGGSLRLWREYFGKQAIIFGIDIDPRCAELDGLNGNVRIGSQSDSAFLKTVVAEMGGVDIVVDDGGHVSRHQIASFEILFPLLAADGIYICEDLHASYWRGKFAGGYRRRTTFVEFAKNIVDDMHADFHSHRQGVHNAHRTIDCIHFYNSMAVIEKSPHDRPRHIRIGMQNPW
ncbi:MAG: class I SAM-dependent methyltransferase [Proteobacteria bacterium]|nr:class I SAM-dependent methyltransferase [Pseudomonadota bacterium]